MLWWKMFEALFGRAFVVLVVIVALMLAACTPGQSGVGSSIRHEQPGGEGSLVVDGNDQATVAMGPETWTITSPFSPPAAKTVDSEGMSKIESGPSSTASVGAYGIAIDIASDATLRNVQRSSWIIGPDGPLEETFSADEITVSNSSVLAEVASITEAALPRAVELYRQDVAAYAAYVEGVREVSGDAADLLGTFVPLIVGGP